LLLKSALQFHIENLADEANITRPLGISQHIANGVFNKGEIADEYFITEIEVPIPHHA
jgi:hypothetical protein